MYKEIYNPPSRTGWEKLGSRGIRAVGRHSRQAESSFRCGHCNAHVFTLPAYSGVQNRNHCPFCLWSRHLDWQEAGDRLSACKAVMQPIGLTIKPTRNKYATSCQGELMVIHQCRDCGKLSINRIAADDQADALMGVFRTSLYLDETTRTNLDLACIKPLNMGDESVVAIQLYGLFTLE